MEWSEKYRTELLERQKSGEETINMPLAIISAVQGTNTDLQTRQGLVQELLQTPGLSLVVAQYEGAIAVPGKLAQPVT